MKKFENIKVGDIVFEKKLKLENEINDTLLSIDIKPN